MGQFVLLYNTKLVNKFIFDQFFLSKKENNTKICLNSL